MQICGLWFPHLKHENLYIQGMKVPQKIASQNHECIKPGFVTDHCSIDGPIGFYFIQMGMPLNRMCGGSLVYHARSLQNWAVQV